MWICGRFSLLSRESTTCYELWLRWWSCLTIYLSLNDLPTSVIIVCNIITKKQATRMKLNDTKPTILYLLSSTQQTSKHEMDKNPVSSKYSYFWKKKQIKNPIHTLTDKMRRKEQCCQLLCSWFRKKCLPDLTWLSCKAHDLTMMMIKWQSFLVQLTFLFYEKKEAPSGSTLYFDTQPFFIYFLIKKH